MSDNQNQTVSITFDSNGNIVQSSEYNALTDKQKDGAINIASLVTSANSSSVTTLINSTIDPSTGKNLPGAGFATGLFIVIEVPIDYLDNVSDLRASDPNYEQTLSDEISAGFSAVASTYISGALAEQAGLAVLAVGSNPIFLAGAIVASIIIGIGAGKLYDKYLKDDANTVVNFFVGKFEEDSYTIYDATVYSQIATTLGISLENFLSAGIDGKTNSSHLAANGTRAVFETGEEAKFYIPVKVNGVEQVVAVDGVYDGGKLIIGRDSEIIYGTEEITYPDILYLNRDANSPIIITTGRSTGYVEGTSIVIGSNGNDNITNSENSAKIYKSATIDGGDGIDTIDYSNLSFGSRDITVNLENHTATNGIALNAFNNVLYNVENIIGSKGDDDISGNASNNTFYGNDGYDNLSGGGGDDSLYGNDGDDKLDGESGNDVLLGGRGFDTYNFSSSFGVDTVNDSDRSGKIVINGNEIKGDAVLLDEGSNGGSNSGGSNNSSNDIHQLSINGVTYYLKMLSGVLLISQDKTAVEVGVGDVVKVEGFVNGQFGINLKNPEDPEFCAGPIVDGWRDAEKTDPDAYYRIDPLTLDLDGDGVELVSLSNSNAFFDLDGDGLRENVGWIKSDDGILVYDANGSGSVDNINELFGDNSALGTVELAVYDFNNDGVINSDDAIFSKLQLWQDYDQDGISDEGELKSLSEYNITSINVKSSDLKSINQEVAGNKILSSNTYDYMVDGVTRTNNIYNLELAINQTDSAFYSYVDEWGNVVDYEVNPETLTLPQSRGYGLEATVL